MRNRDLRSKQILLALAVPLLLSLPSAPTGASAYNDWTGTWRTNYGDLTLAWTKDGSIAGTFGKSGRLEGKPADYWAKVIRGTWSADTSGTFEFLMADDMKSFHGWRNSPATPWRGTRDTVPEPID